MRPSVLQTGSQSGNSITVSWNPVEGAESYNVYVNGNLKAENVPTATYTITGLEAGTTYEIEIAGVNQNGEGSKSLILAAKTLSIQTVPGDMNGDGDLTVADVVLLRRAVLANGTATDYPAGDLNTDDGITVADVVLLRRAVLAAN